MQKERRNSFAKKFYRRLMMGGGDGGEPTNPSTDTKGGKNWRLWGEAGLGGGGIKLG